MEDYCKEVPHMDQSSVHQVSSHGMKALEIAK